MGVKESKSEHKRLDSRNAWSKLGGAYRVRQLVGPGAYKLVRMDGHEVKRPWNAAHLRKYFQ